MRVSKRSKSGLRRGNISLVGLTLLPALTGRSQSGRVPTMQAENQLVGRMMPRVVLAISGVSPGAGRPWSTTVPSHPCEQAHGIRLAPAGTPEHLAVPPRTVFAAVRLVSANERRKSFQVGRRFESIG